MKKKNLKNLTKKELDTLAKLEAKVDMLKEQIKVLDSNYDQKTIQKLSDKVSDIEIKIDQLIQAATFRNH